MIGFETEFKKIRQKDMSNSTITNNVSWRRCRVEKKNSFASFAAYWQQTKKKAVEGRVRKRKSDRDLENFI